jgi:hypothetical protein
LTEEAEQLAIRRPWGNTERWVLPASTMYSLPMQDDGRITPNSTDTSYGMKASWHIELSLNLIYQKTPASNPGESSLGHPNVLSE